MNRPPLSTVVPDALPPEKAISVPPALTMVAVAKPSPDTICVPPELTVVPLAVPPADTVSVPPAPTIAPLATPPDETVSPPRTVFPISVPRTVSLPLTVAETPVPPAATISEPPTLTVFADNAVGHEIILTDLRSQPLTVAEVRTSSPQVHGKVTDQFQDGQGHSVRKIHLEVASDYAEGRHDEVVDIVTNDPLYRNLQVPVTVVKRTRQRLSAAPATVSHRPGCSRAPP